MINVTDPTPTGVVTAVNAADIGVSASLVDTGASSNQYKLVLAGELGADNAFTISDTTSTGTQLGLTDRLSTASNAELEINGIDIQRPTNIIDDAVTGITLTLSAATAATSRLSVERDTSGVRSRIEELVATFNSMAGSFRDLRDPDSGDEQAGVFSGNGSMRLIAQTVTGLMTSESSTTTDNLSYLSDIGIMLNRYGELEIDDEVFTEALSDRFAEIVTLLSADTNNQTTIGDADRGIAGDAIQTPDRSDGVGRDDHEPEQLAQLQGRRLPGGPGGSRPPDVPDIRALPSAVYCDGAEGRPAEQHPRVPEDGARESPVLQPKINNFLN